jgi:hypothetical protein
MGNSAAAIDKHGCGQIPLSKSDYSEKLQKWRVTTGPSPKRGEPVLTSLLRLVGLTGPKLGSPGWESSPGKGLNYEEVVLSRLSSPLL